MPVSVRTRKFFCCLPARLGAFILAILAMIGGSFVAGIGFLQLGGAGAGRPIDKSDAVALWIQTIMYSILGIVGAFGFVGVLIKNIRMISGFAFVLALHLGFSVASGIFSIYAMFTQDPTTAVIQCIGNATASGVDVTLQDCQNGITVMKGVMVAVYIITWLLQLYAYFVVERYADQLEDEEMAEQTRVVPRSLPEISAPLNQMSAYSGYNSGYPFIDSRQAYGSSSISPPPTHPRRDHSNMV
jgi:hypothetical protein